MRQVFSQMVQRPTAAFVSSMQMLNQELPVRYVIDAVVSRFIFTFIRPLGSEGLQTTSQREEDEETRSIPTETWRPEP